jgi:hypothetical protein
VPIKKGLQQFHDWINDGDYAHPRFCTDREEMVYVGKNQGVGVMVTGTTDWRDYRDIASFARACRYAGY